VLRLFYRLMARRMRGYADGQARQIFRDLIDMPANIPSPTMKSAPSRHPPAAGYRVRARPTCRSVGRLPGNEKAPPLGRSLS
jgi:hypothetical protein